MASAQIPLEPWDESDQASARHGASFSAHMKILRAIALLTPVVISLAERRPKGFTLWEADAALHNLREALLRLRLVDAKYDAAEKRGTA